jgi:hypothetical protein
MTDITIPPPQMKRVSDTITQKVQAGALHGHVLDELREIRSVVAHSMHSQVMRNLMKNKWFLKIVHNLHEHKKKMKTPVPPSLIRLLAACAKLLEHCTPLDEELFFELLEQLLRPGDQKDVIVHRYLPAC